MIYSAKRITTWRALQGCKIKAVLVNNHSWAGKLLPCIIITKDNKFLVLQETGKDENEWRGVDISRGNKTECSHPDALHELADIYSFLNHGLMTEAEKNKLQGQIETRKKCLRHARIQELESEIARLKALP